MLDAAEDETHERKLIHFPSVSGKSWGRLCNTLNGRWLLPVPISSSSQSSLHKPILWNFPRIKHSKPHAGVCCCQICRCMLEGTEGRCRDCRMLLCCLSGDPPPAAPLGLLVIFSLKGSLLRCPLAMLQVTELPFFATRVRLGRGGAEEIFPLGPLNEYER